MIICKRPDPPDDNMQKASSSRWSFARGRNLRMIICNNDNNKDNNINRGDGGDQGDGGDVVSCPTRWNLFHHPDKKEILHSYVLGVTGVTRVTRVNFKILTNPCAQSLKKKLALGPNVSSKICNKLLPAWSSATSKSWPTLVLKVWKKN